jgi:integrase
MPENLWKWLELTPANKRKGNIIPVSYNVFRNARDRACKETKLKWIQDGLRHSFTSYAWHFLGAEHTVEILGHEGGFEVLKKHYKGMATKAEADEYFKIV